MANHLVVAAWWLTKPAPWSLALPVVVVVAAMAAAAAVTVVVVVVVVAAATVVAAAAVTAAVVVAVVVKAAAAATAAAAVVVAKAAAAVATNTDLRSHLRKALRGLFSWRWHRNDFDLDAALQLQHLADIVRTQTVRKEKVFSANDADRQMGDQRVAVCIKV